LPEALPQWSRWPARCDAYGSTFRTEARYTNGTAGEVGATPWNSLDDRVGDIAVDLTYQQGGIWDRQLKHI